jgi:hypothetical protein
MALNINGTTGISGVDGSVSAPALTGTDSNTGITFPAADTIKFATGGVERMSITNSGVSGITAGITQADQWRTTSYFDASSTTLVNANWERNDTDFALIGSGMTESSGIFTFPATGIYKIDFVLVWYRSAAQNIRYVASNIETTTDNSNFNLRGLAYGNLPNDAGVHATISQNIIFDVTDTSTHKVRFRVEAEDTVTFLGETSRNQTCATFIRLGDT